MKPFRSVALILCLSSLSVVAQTNDSLSKSNSASVTQDRPKSDEPGTEKKKAPPQDKNRPVPTNSECGVTSLTNCFKDVVHDQSTMWASPFRVKPHDLVWLAPVGAATGLLISSDEHNMAREQSNALAIRRSNSLANDGLYGFLALPVALYGWGSLRQSPQVRESGILSGEALVDSLVIDEVLKYGFGRQRPTITDGSGNFFKTTSNPSFPSTHAMLSWTVASVISHEFPGWLTEAATYGVATAVSASRVTGRQHFPSDVVVGSTLGWLVGRQVYRARHEPTRQDLDFGTFDKGNRERHNTDNTPSTFVPLDSWIYPALERLSAVGFINTQFVGLQPWTRRECLRQAEEAEALGYNAPQRIQALITSIKKECIDDEKAWESLKVESIYTRYVGIQGQPLRDSYHFGQTIINDFGRPYDEGNNVVSGASFSATAGQFFGYFRGEYQHAPGRGPLTDTQRTLIAGLDFNPVEPATPVAATNQFHPLEMYAGVELGQYALTFGKQSLWLGPSESGPLMLSDNADPMYMLRVSRTTPLVLPSILGLLGPIRGEFIFAKLSGHQFPARPFFNLQKISLHPTRNLELGFTRASISNGVGHPFTARNLIRNFVSTTSTPANNNAADRSDPGDRKAGFDFSYRVPGLRDWLSIYSDSFSDDDPSPIGNPRRAAINPGILVSQVPKIDKLELRAEAVSTQSLVSVDRGPQFFYWNNQYHDANTNKGNLFGSAVGRDGRGFLFSSRYWFTARTQLSASYRDVKTSRFMLPGGGTQNNGTVRLLCQLRDEWSVEAIAQYERWLIPTLRPSPQNDFAASVQITFHPDWMLRH
jgi:hypothetical protein